MKDSSDWLRTRKRLLTQVRNQVSQRLGVAASRGLVAYGRRYEEEFQGRWRPIAARVLRRAIVDAEVVLGADFHAFSQAQRVHLRILREIPAERPVVLALECFESQHQPLLDRFLAGRIGEERFLRLIRWEERWGFPWENFRPLVELAKARGYRVVGLNRFFSRRSAATLAQRDRHAAQCIAEVHARYPGHLIYVVFGDLHLAADHLPRRLVSAWPEARRRMVVLFQDSERLYFQLARRNLEGKVEVLAARDGRYCICASPPWVRWQSYLMFLEQKYDVDLDEEGWAGAVDHTDHVHNLIQFAARDLGLRLKSDDIAVYGSGQRSVYQNLARSLSPADRKWADFHIRNDLSFFIPRGGLVYLSRATVNHAATLAGAYLQARLSRRTRPLWDQPADFSALIWSESLAFFVSKLINHKRKADSLRDIRAQLDLVSPRDRGREALLLVLDQRMSEIIWVHSGRQRRKRFKPRRPESYFTAARILGQMLGERLYVAYRSGRIDRQTVVSFLKKNTDSRDFVGFYMKVVKRLESEGALSPVGRLVL